MSEQMKNVVETDINELKRVRIEKLENLVKEVADFTVTFTVIDESGNKNEKQIIIFKGEFYHGFLLCN